MCVSKLLLSHRAGVHTRARAHTAESTYTVLCAPMGCAGALEQLRSHLRAGASATMPGTSTANCHTRTVLSKLADARHEPSGFQHTEGTQLL